MGVEHYMVCHKCKEYIDLHKAYAFSAVLNDERPSYGPEDVSSSMFRILNGNYWETRGLWFIWHHRSHGSELRLHVDTDNEWWNLEPNLKEVFPFKEDLKLRSNED